jgi:hypothetical protein
LHSSEYSFDFVASFNPRKRNPLKVAPQFAVSADSNCKNALDRGADLFGRLRVEAVRCLIENENLWSLEQGTRAMARRWR